MTPKGMTVLLAVQPVDMRRSFDGLARCVQEQLGRDARTERAMFVFVNKRRDLLKLLWRDATGWCLLAKRLDKNVVALPDHIPKGYEHCRRRRHLGRVARRRRSRSQ
jgi:transposase